MKRRNSKPEQILTIIPCLSWGREHGFSLHQVESKAVFSKAIGRYKRGMTTKGFPDIVGCTPDGIAVFIEGKAPGSLSDLKPHQRDFLLDKILKGCFAVCVDSPQRLALLYDRWKLCPSAMGKSFLLRALPEVPKKRPRKTSVPV